MRDKNNSHMTWEQWPQSVPRPTQQEWDAAEKRMREESEVHAARLKAEGKPPYMGDCGYFLSFDMATCSIETWWHLFFPVGVTTKSPVEKEVK